MATVATVGLAACSGDGPATVDTIAFDTLASSTTIAAAPTTAAPTTTSESTTSVEDPTTTPTTAADGLTGPMFSDALGVKVDTAPGVHTRGDTRQLMPEGLYVHIAWEPDPDDPSVFTVQPEDIDILEAYANAVATYYRAATTTVTTDSPDFAKYYVDGGELFATAFEQARDGGYLLDLGSGVVLRPYLLADQRTDSTATILDCYLQDEIYVVPGAERDSGPLVPKGQIVTMALSGDQWRIDQAGSEQGACF